MHPHSSLNAQWRVETLTIRRHSMDLADEFHPLDHPTEGGEALTIRVALALGNFFLYPCHSSI